MLIAGELVVCYFLNEIGIFGAVTRQVWSFLPPPGRPPEECQSIDRSGQLRQSGGIIGGGMSDKSTALVININIGLDDSVDFVAKDD